MKLIKPLILSLLLCFCIIACTSLKTNVKPSQTITVTFAKKQPLTDEEKKDWHFKDIYTDSIPGISLEKAYDFLNNKKGDTVIVAVIDTELDITQEDLKNQIWVNTNEIPNNNIDDDNNGYIDDIHGWNYVGTKKGDKIPYSSYEYVRIIKKYDSLFKKITLKKEVSENQQEQFKLYQKSYLEYNKRVTFINSEIARFNRIRVRYNKAIITTKKYFFDESYDVNKLDSLKNELTDKEEIKNITELLKYTRYGIDKDWIDGSIEYQNYQLNTVLNFEYNDRYLTNDNTNDLNDFPYGNNNVQGIYAIGHATQIASVIAANRNNNLDIDGINNLVKIMPLSIAVVGNEFDKDIALAIRYAVDNGAKIINMSLGKTFSMYPEWVNEALKYAESKNVLVITSSGNTGLNIDKNDDFPTDNFNGVETVKNFIKVGNTSRNIDSTLVFSSSNYGKKNVDIYAPGTKIPCMFRSEKVIDTGTSLSSAVVSGVASLLFSYYPDLSATEVKQIIIKSGTSYDMNVLKPYPRGEKRDPKKVPFSSLSKSGKIVNAYNALLLAEEVSKKKKRKRN